MKIADIRIESSTLPKRDKEWKFALGGGPEANGLIVTIVAEDGSEGYGYGSGSPHYGATLESVKTTLERFKKRLIGEDSRRIAAIMADLDRSLVGNTHAKNAIDCALHDLLARRLGIGTCELFGGPAVTEFRTLRILPIKSPADKAANARRLYDDGVRHFKIKVHGDVEEDVARVAAIREEVGKDAHLTIDANQSYQPKDAIRAITLMAPFTIELAEQPVPANDLRGLKLVTDAVPVVVEADEAAYSLDQVFRICQERAADAISLKLFKMGGLRATLAAARLCEAAGLRYRLGAHSGPRIVAAHAVNLAAALPGIWYNCELTLFEDLAEDPWEGLVVEDGVLKLPTGPGCGVTRRASALKAVG